MQLPKNKYKWLLLPCLNKVREFDGKLLLAAVAAERGWGVVLGYKNFIKHNIFDVAGVVIEMSFKSEDLDRHIIINRKICAWDEEGLVYLNGEDYYQRRLKEDSIKQLECAFLWGHNQKQIIDSHIEGVESKLYITGNPRFDMLRPEFRNFYAPDVDRIQKRYGRFILVNTNFGYINHYFGKDYTFKNLQRKGKISTPEHEQDQLARETFEQGIMEAFIEMIPTLNTRFQGHKIIIRPHPSENFQTWEAITKRLSNTHVVHEDDVIPWLLAADATIHNSCTTGIQGYLMGRPVISYMPLQSEKYDKYLPNSVSICVQNEDDLITAMQEILSENPSTSPAQNLDKQQIIDEHIAGFKGPWSSERVMDILETLQIEPQVLKFNTTAETVNPPARSNISSIKGILKMVRNWFFPQFAPATPKQKYIRQTFPPIDLNEVKKDLLRLQQITNRFANIQVCQTGDDTICVHPSEE